MTELPREVVDAAERLTRLARRAVDDAEAAAYERDRDERLAEYGFTARIRESDDTLVCHPAEWLEGDTVRMDRIEDTDRAVEVSLSGSGDPESWDAVETHNAEVVEAVAERAGAVHAANARAFADFMGNHYARRVETATAAELREFLTEYYPRNAWPSDEQRDAVERSLEHVFAVTETDGRDRLRTVTDHDGRN
ncbi:rnhA operon protein [Haloplanus rubicundus]|uniref:RnhA operon protein n=1 Tax=Haloplanus rubicundus TaxID=1547898 RepID=A0A345E2M1_9EURY|nr:rnhA operon protein [Haloplanus rubicundus]AXG06443.1 rnhA operon protein [Haloplanus rubicundus]